MRGYNVTSTVVAVLAIAVAAFLGFKAYASPPVPTAPYAPSASPTALSPTTVPPTVTPTPTTCTVTTPTNDSQLVRDAIAKLNLPQVVGKLYPVVTPQDLLAYFSITGVDATHLVVDSDCATVQLEPVPSRSGFVPVNACNPTDRRYDGWRSALQAGGVTLSDQQGFPTGQWSMEGISWAPNPDDSPILAAPGVCN